MLLLSSLKLCYSQQMISIDTAEVYILSYFTYSGYKDSLNENLYKIAILENNVKIEQELECGTLSYQYIPFSDQQRSYKISRILEENFKANLIFETSFPYLQVWLAFLNSQRDSLSEEFDKIYKIYTDTNTRIMIDSDGPDILGDKISKELEGSKYTDSCTFSYPGVY